MHSAGRRGASLTVNPSCEALSAALCASARTRVRALCRRFFYFTVHWSRNTGASGRATLLGSHSEGALPDPPPTPPPPLGDNRPWEAGDCLDGPLKLHLLVATSPSRHRCRNILPQQARLVNRRRENRQVWPEEKKAAVCFLQPLSKIWSGS